jgi:hypothetical protein
MSRRHAIEGMSGKNSHFRIVSPANAMTEGLFGEVLLHVFEILPYLHAKGIFPDWQIQAAHYGGPPRGSVIPGAVDIAYEVAPGARQDIALTQVRRRHCHALGNDWQQLHNIWNAYFRIPPRILRRADDLGALSDKRTALWDTNRVSHDDYLAIIRDVLKRRPDLKRVFLATDEFGFCDYLSRNLSIEIINLGAVDFHKAPVVEEAIGIKTDRAILDCVVLSRCSVVLQNSSALSGFAKVFNPTLEIWRIAASKRFADIPYFPAAYIPAYTSPDPEISTLIERLMFGDWASGDDADRFKQRFISRPRYRIASSLLRRIRNRGKRIGNFVLNEVRHLVE